MTASGAFFLDPVGSAIRGGGHISSGVDLLLVRGGSSMKKLEMTWQSRRGHAGVAGKECEWGLDLLSLGDVWGPPPENFQNLDACSYSLGTPQPYFKGRTFPLISRKDKFHKLMNRLLITLV